MISERLTSKGVGSLIRCRVYQYLRGGKSSSMLFLFLGHGQKFAMPHNLHSSKADPSYSPSGDGGYQHLLAKGFSKQEIHSAMHKFMLLQIQHKKQSHTPRLTSHFSRNKRSSSNHQIAKSSNSSIITLIKYQIAKLFSLFAKKPKNPV